MAKMCDMCGKRPATTFTTYTINGVTTQQCLCSECAKKYDMQMNFNPEDIIASVFGFPDRDRRRPRTYRQCPVCGATEQSILDNYQFGCSECYKTFSDLASEIARRMGQGYHVGKNPRLTGGKKVDATAKKKAAEPIEEDELTRLKRELAKAVEEERFDDASTFKKKIDAIKGKGDK